MADELYVGYVCPGFYPIAAHDLTHTASLFALWKARRKFGQSATCDQVFLQEELVNGAKFQVRLMGQKDMPGETYRFTVMVDGA